MDKNDIKHYIDKLKKFEKELTSGEFQDLSIFTELDNLLVTLNNEAKNEMLKDSVILSVKIKKLHSNAIIPTYSKDGDAAMDFFATEIISQTPDRIVYGTGVAMEVPKGFVGLLFPRSSIRKYDLSLANSVGILDSGYRGEIQFTFNRLNTKSALNVYKIGERIGQIMILPHPTINFIESEELSDSERGEGGHGSTGS